MTTDRFEKLVKLLEELFQLDQPELDFGFYRIMHARREQVTKFLRRELLPQVREALEQVDDADRELVRLRLREAQKQAKALGADPETLPKVRELRKKLEDTDNLDATEADVYDHLYRFFRRYYSNGDFLSRRVYKDSVYALPYQGEEVKLHWANADQYYIKTDEYLRNYAFRLRPNDEADPMRVRFRLRDAAEGEHDNVKPLPSAKRVFTLHAGDFVRESVGEQGPELVLDFCYRPATLGDWPRADRDGKKKPPRQKDLLAAADKRILERLAEDPALGPWAAELDRRHTRANGQTADYSRLRGHLERYAARNTTDYFIHKDLGGFLRRELDFYIKNEVMRLDDIEHETASRVEQYLSKIRAIRRVAGKVIDFLAQLEDFQKRLWLKKKFVIETSWLVRLGCIPDEFLPEIAANEAQHREWVDLCAIDKIEGDLSSPGYAAPLTVAFLRAHPSLVVDTRHFRSSIGTRTARRRSRTTGSPAKAGSCTASVTGQDFSARLLQALGDIESQTEGVLAHSENFQALKLMQALYRRRIHCIYVDPPYNTEMDRAAGKFTYKDGYAYSTWCSMIANRASLAHGLLRPTGAQYTSIDDVMYPELLAVMAQTFGRENHIATVIWEKVHTRKNSARHFSVSHDYIPCFARAAGTWERVLLPRTDTSAYTNPDRDPRGLWKADPVYANNPYDADYTITKPNGTVLRRPPGQYWRLSEASWRSKVDSKAVVWGNGDSYPMVKRYLTDVQDGLVPVTIFDRKFAGDNARANAELDALFGPDRVFSYPKPTLLIRRLVQTNVRPGSAGTILDYFAGSGTTGHAVINLNREDGGRRQFVLVEMGQHFWTVLVPRLKKVIYSPEWKDARPRRPPTVEETERSPRLIKVLRLESFEDTLNNLRVPGTDCVNARGGEFATVPEQKTTTPPLPPRMSGDRIRGRLAASVRAVCTSLHARRRKPGKCIPA